MKKIIVLLLCLALILPLLACGQEGKTTNLMDGVRSKPVKAELDSTRSAAVTDFAVRLYRHTAQPGENTLVSPLSVLCALSMTANGARGETLTQMEAALGLPVEALNQYLYAYRTRLSRREQGCQLNLANSIWYKETPDFEAERAFLQTNANYYGAGLYKAPFDQSTLTDVNQWVSDQTKGRIQQILEEIPQDVVMYLVNALSFDGEWADPYRESQVEDGIFTCEDGTEQTVPMMYSEEYAYLEDALATGFLKYYKGGYAFAALLPKEGVSVSDYAASLTGEKLHGLLTASRAVTVEAAMPKFSCRYGKDLAEILPAMGMTDAFQSELADLSGIGHSANGDLYISGVLHQTYLAVNEAGTEAAAATVVVVPTETEPMIPETKTVTLDRPFLFLLVDTEELVPIFMGAVMEIEQ